MPQTKSSKLWLTEHFSDSYVKEAKNLGYRSRSAFKLLEIQKKDNIVKPGMTIVDLGASPGGWSQVAVKLLKGNGQIIALDILNMEDIERVDFIQGDFREENVLKKLSEKINNTQIDLVMSDMSPNISGIKSKDQASMIYLAELALEFAKQNLKQNGTFLVKLFQGQDSQEYLKTLKDNFKNVYIRKPKSSRNRSSEIYLLAKELR